jgi:hypothetical protein
VKIAAIVAGMILSGIVMLWLVMRGADVPTTMSSTGPVTDTQAACMAPDLTPAARSRIPGCK